MEESPDADPVEVSEVAAAVNIPPKINASKTDPEIAVYELNDEDEFDDELAFIIFSVTTNAAFDLVRQAEEDLIAQASEVFDGKRTYESIAMIVFYADAFQQGVSPEARLQSNESLRVTTFDDFIYLSTAKILMKFTYMADLPAGHEPTYPAPCPPLRFSYISRPELLGTPEMNRKEQEDLSLSRLIIDRQLWNTFKQVASPEASSPPFEDEFGQSLDKLTKQGLLSAALVFEARIYLDVQDIMGDSVERGYEDLVRNTNKIDKIMNLKVVDGAWDVGGTGERWHERDTEVVMRIKQTSMFWILDNPANAFPKFKEYCLASNPSQETHFFCPTEAEVSPQEETSQRLTNIPGRSTTTKMPSKKSMPPKDQ
ncbi:MAG: hypothetical protein Q9192_005785 [Flavoplaca navasiana]